MRKLARNGLWEGCDSKLRAYRRRPAEVSPTEASADFQRSVAKLLLMCPFRMARTVHVR